MRKNRLLAPLAVLMSLALTACGGGSDTGAFQNPASAAGAQATSKAAAIQTTTSSATLPSDGSGSVDVKVFVRDANNVLLPNATVTFTATSGGLSAAQATTDSGGVATVTLSTAGDPSARTITVTAKVGTTLTSTVTVSVITSVSKVTLTSDSSALAGDGSAATTLRAQVLNMNNQAAVGAMVSFTSTSGGILLVTQAVTDASGVATAKISSDKNNVKVNVDATASSGGVASNTISLKVVNSVDLTRSLAALPSDGSQTSTLTATVKDVSGNAIAGLPVTFDGGSGVVTASQGVTDTNGVATAVLSVGKDTTDRTITVTASVGGLVGKTTITVAAQVTAVSVSSNVSTIPTDGSSPAVITAIVRNSNNQFVAGVPVSFTASSGGIAVTQGVTDANGVAKATLTTANDPTPRTISVTAIAAGIQSSPVSVQVSGVGPNTVASVVVTSNPTALPTDGSLTSTITATVLNAKNVGVAGVPVSFQASSGTLAVITAVTNASGQATATLSIGSDHSARTITINATAGASTGSASVSVGGLYIVTATTSAPSIPSDGSLPAEIRALVRDANNQLVQNVPVTFTATSGGLVVTQAITDPTGTAIAKLSPASDPTNRTITVTASASGISAQVNVDVIGTTLTIQGPSKLTTSQVGSYSALLVDSGNHPIVGKALTVTSTAGNTLSTASAATDGTGRINFTMTATQATSPDTLSVSGLGLTATKSIDIDVDSFAFTQPVAGAQINLGAAQTVKLRWTTGVGLTPVVGSTVQFATTRGTITASAVTDVNGDATVTLSSATAAGGALVTATAAGGKTAQLSVEFVATTPTSISLQPDSFSIGPNQSTNITAVVRDVNGNLVKNQVVLFTLNDLSGGTLSTGVATTDSTGRATTVYTASSLTNPSVVITGVVQGTAVTGTTTLAVGKQALFITLGTGNSIDEPNVAQYHIRYQVQVTDANGNGVAGAALSARVLSIQYKKGYRAVSGSKWATTITATCNDEDVNRNGVLDLGSEDINGNKRLDAGNIVTVTPINATTDANGFASLDLYYPQEYAYYLNVDLSVSTTLQGTEYTRTSNFTVPGVASDFSDVNTVPPGVVSPFGQAAVCTDPT